MIRDNHGYKTRSGADSAARRELRKHYGRQYEPQARCDFIVYYSPRYVSYAFEIIGHRDTTA